MAFPIGGKKPTASITKTAMMLLLRPQEAG